MSFTVNFVGRLKKIRAPITYPLHALFEAVANAFDATDDLGEKGHITVHILRQPAASLLSATEGPQYVLSGFEIEDNGVGFTDDNFTYFKCADTTNKTGGKGVGRLLWLKVFNRAEVASVYEDVAAYGDGSSLFQWPRTGLTTSTARLSLPTLAGPRLPRLVSWCPKKTA